jgi:hypothetical protein
MKLLLPGDVVPPTLELQQAKQQGETAWCEHLNGRYTGWQHALG